MAFITVFRSRAGKFLRAFWPLVIVLAGGITCDSPVMPMRPGVVTVEPVLSLQGGIAAFAGLSVDQVRITVIRPGPPLDTIAVGTFAFSPDADTLRTNLAVDIEGNAEQLDVVIELMSGAAIMFTGTQTVTVTTSPPTGGTPPPTVPLTFIGPGSGIASINLAPRDSGIGLGGQLQFRAAPVDSASAVVPQYYLSWSTSNPAHDINANGLLRAGNARGTFWVFARTPTGIRDSTRLTVSPVATTMLISSGNNQAGSAGSALPQPLTVQVRAADNLGVAGVPVTFAAGTGGGSVNPTVVATDSMGFASTTATLGAASGQQTFTAAAPGIAGVTFSANAGTAQSPTITLSMAGNGSVANGRTEALTATLGVAAPAGGLVVSIISDSTSYLTVAAPGTISIAAGGTSGSINITGHASNIGLARVRALATGYITDTTFIPVIPAIIQMAPTLNVAVSATATLAVTLNFPAPAGGVAVSLTSSDPTIATVTPTLNFIAGATTMNATVTGVAAGSAAILATAPGYLQGGTAVTVGSGGVPTSISKTAGDNQTAFINDTTAVRPQVRVLDAGGAPVAGVAVTFTVASGGGSIVGSGSVATDAAGFARLNGQWRLGGAAGANTMTASLPGFPGVTAVTFSATASLPPPVIALAIFGSNVVGQARTGQLQVKLLQAAPAGGVTVTLATTRAGLLRIGSYTSDNGSASFATGDTMQTVTVFGDSSVIGIDTVIATAPGYTPDTLAVPVSLNLISLPTTLNVPFNQSVSLPVNLSVAAPAGGLKVAIQSSLPGTVQVLTDTITIPAGSVVGNATVLGAALGTATVTATNPNYAPDAATVSVTATLNITVNSISPNESFPLPITVQLESGGTPIGAPAGGVALTFLSRNPACVAAPSGTTIAQGLVNATAQVAYGGSATTPCSAYLLVQGPAGYAIDSVQVNMQPIPPISVTTTQNIGSGLQRPLNASLGASNHGGTTVRITSANPAVALVARTATDVGSAFVDVPMGLNTTNIPFYLVGMDGRIADTTEVVFTAPGFRPDTMTVRVWQAVYYLSGLNNTGTTLTVNDAFWVEVGTPSSPTGTLSQNDEVRAGHPPITVSFINDSAATADLVTQSLTADSVTLPLPSGTYFTPTTLSQGGVELDYQAQDTVTIRARVPGMRALANASVNVNVSAPVVNLSASMNLGSGLQRNSSGSLSASAHGGVTVTLQSLDSSVVLLSPNATTAGAGTVTINVPVNGTSFSFYVQAMEGILADTVKFVASAPGFTPDTIDVRVWQPVYYLSGLNTTGTTLTANDAFWVEIGTPTNPTTGGISQNDEIRFGGQPLLVSFINDSIASADLITQTLTADSVTVTLPVGTYFTPTTLASGGVELDYQAQDTVTIRVRINGLRALPQTSQNVQISQPAISVTASMNLGSGLQRPVNASLGASQHGGVTVAVTSLDPSVAVIAPNATTAGSASINVVLANGATNVPFTVQALDNLVDTIAVVVSAPGFTPDTMSVRVWQPVYYLSGINTTGTTLSANDDFWVEVGTPTNPTTGGLSQNDERRRGGGPITVTIASSQAAVAGLVTQSLPVPDDTVTVTIPEGSYFSSTQFTTGGASVDYQTTGTSVINASIPSMRAVTGASVTVTVSAPAISMSGPVTVAAGLQQSASLTLGAPAPANDTLIIRSSNPAIALVQPNATTPASDSIVIALATGQTFVSYYVAGVENQTGTVSLTSRAQGYVDGSVSVNVVQPGVQIVSLPTTGTTATANRIFWAEVGVPNGSNTGISNNQDRRAGAAPLTVTFTSSNTTVGTLVTTTPAQSGSPLTAQITAGTYFTPTVASQGAMHFDYLTAGQTTVAAAIAGFVATVAASVIVTIN